MQHYKVDREEYDHPLLLSRVLHTFVNVGVTLFSQLLEFGVCRVCRDHEVDELNSHTVRVGFSEMKRGRGIYLPSGRLAAFVHPPAREDNILVWTPHAVDEDALRALYRTSIPPMMPMG